MSLATLLSDAELLDRLEDGSVDPEAFSHREHVRAGWAALRRYGLLAALARYSGALRALTHKVGRPERYHETITVASLLLIHERLGPTDEGFDTFAARCPELFAKPGPLEQLYPPTTLEGALARQHFVLPAA
jgi:hypothetical protein